MSLPVFKTGAPSDPRWAGSIPVRLRQGSGGPVRFPSASAKGLLTCGNGPASIPALGPGRCSWLCFVEPFAHGLLTHAITGASNASSFAAAARSWSSGIPT